MAPVAMQSRTEVHIDLDKAIEDLSTEKVLKVGWVEKNRYPAELGGIYVAEAAAMNEYGVPHRHVPARPFMRPAIAHNKNEWVELISKGAEQAILGKTDIQSVLEKVGERISGDIKEAIVAVTAPPLSPVTIANRLNRYSRKTVGSLTKPLIDTGIMLASVTHTVEPE